MRRIARLRSLALAAVLPVVLCACGGPEGGAADDSAEAVLVTAEVLRENVDILYGLASIERYNPPRASRLFAYAYVALYEGWVRGVPGLETLVGRLNGLDALPEPEAGVAYDWPTVALTAELGVVSLILEGAQPFSLFELETFVERQIEARREAGVGGGVVERSQQYGEALAEALSAWADADRYAERWDLNEYEPGRTEGSWVPTADYGMSIPLNQVTQMVQLFEEDDWREVRESDELRSEWLSDRMLLTARPSTITNPNTALEPGWRHLRPFVLSSVAEVAPPGPYPYATDPESDFYRDAYEVYRVSKELTGFDFATGHYWADLPAQTGTPAGHWLKIAMATVEQNEVAFPQALQALTLTAVAFADAFIACWDTKYGTDVVRPVTYIREQIDPTWVPVIVTPPFPEYTAGHSVQSFAAAQTLTGLFGDLGFTDDTHVTRYGFPARTYGSFLEAAQEASDSRLYGGIHYPKGLADGDRQGARIGELVVERLR
ncbi:MAG: vanadium-dependent haloperoxidase [Gemmatimonadetes bacterium]|nr:vanadium-dependent haloperoxidase [Gemmatimonadota bacterium]